MKLQLSLITIMFLCTMTTISSTSKDHEVGNINTQNMEELRNLTPNQTSQYNGVYWHKNNKKWEAMLMHNKKRYFGGSFDNKEQAAMSVNLLCDKMGKERRNPMIDIGADVMKQQFKNQTSQYNGVCWNNNEKKWHAKLKHNKKTCSGGYFDNEEQAAMSINLLCDKIGKERKNPNVIMEPDVNKEIKVEEESILGGFKHKCEDRFVQSNEESCITSASCESKKRNRKEELTTYE